MINLLTRIDDCMDDDAEGFEYTFCTSAGQSNHTVDTINNEVDTKLMGSA